MQHSASVRLRWAAAQPSAHRNSPLYLDCGIAVDSHDCRRQPLNQELAVHQLVFEFAGLSSIYQHSNISLMPTSCMSASSARVRRHSR